MDGQSVAGKRDGYDLRTLRDFERKRALWRRDDGGNGLRFTVAAGSRSQADDAHDNRAEPDNDERRKSCLLYTSDAADEL